MVEQFLLSLSTVASNSVNRRCCSRSDEFVFIYLFEFNTFII